MSVIKSCGRESNAEHAGNEAGVLSPRNLCPNLPILTP
jgi:hypothetical protein